MSLILVRQIINVFLENPVEGKIISLLTLLNDGEDKIDIIKFSRPYDPASEKYLYLVNLEVRDNKGILLEIIPQRDPCCGENLLCIKYTIEPKTQKTIIMSHTLRPRVKYGGKLIKFVEFPHYLIGMHKSSNYLHVTPPPNLSLKLVKVKPLAPTQPIPLTSVERCRYEVLAKPPKCRGFSIRFEGECVFETTIKVEFPKSVRIWLYSVLVLPCISLFVKILNLLGITCILLPFGLSLSMNVGLPTLLSCIGTLVATRVWLFYDEVLTNRLNILYIALIIALSITLLFS